MKAKPLAIGVSESTLTNWETGKKPISKIGKKLIYLINTETNLIDKLCKFVKEKEELERLEK